MLNKQFCINLITISSILFLVYQIQNIQSHNHNLPHSVVPSYTGPTFNDLFLLYLKRDIIKQPNDVTWSPTILMPLVLFYDKPVEGDNLRDVCYHMSKWVDKVANITIISRTNPNCVSEKIFFVSRSALKIPENIMNPYELEWFTSKINFESNFIFISDDMIPSFQTDKIITDFLYTKTKLKIQTPGDFAIFKTIRQMSILGGDLIDVPIYFPMHGPQVINRSIVTLAIRKLRLKLDGTMGTRSDDTWSMQAAVGALKSLSGESAFYPDYYFQFHWLSSELSPWNSALYYCINDGPELVNMSIQYKIIDSFFNK